MGPHKATVFLEFHHGKPCSKSVQTFGMTDVTEGKSDECVSECLLLNAQNRRMEPEGPNELEIAYSKSKETKLAELFKKLDSRRELELSVIQEEEEPEEDVGADHTESVVEAAAATTESNSDNHVVADSHVVVAESKALVAVAAVATNTESTQTDTARKLSRSTQTAKPKKSREDSAKVMACLMLSTINDIMSAIMKAFRHKSYVSSITNHFTPHSLDLTLI